MMVLSSTKRWTWRRVAEDNQAQLNKALELLQVAEAENEQWRTDWLNMQAENERLRTALQGIADNPDPLQGKCYCRWSQSVAREALR